MNTLDQRITTSIIELMARRGLKLVEKESSRFMKVLAFLLFFTNFPRYTTTIGSTVYVPRERAASSDVWITYCHELTHYEDAKSLPPLFFSLSYLFPQILAAFSLLSFLAFFLGSTWLLCLLFLLFLLPFPAPFRKKWELRGYAISMTAPSWSGYPKRTPSEFVHYFAGWGYYKMWPFVGVRTELETWHDYSTQDIVDRIPAAALMIEVVHSAMNGNDRS